jgi:hypothetical protein
MLGATDRWWFLERGILGEEGLSITLNWSNTPLKVASV